MSTAMNPVLRPSTLGEILDHTVQTYRRNFWMYVGIAAMPFALAIVLAIPVLLIFAIPGIAGSGVGTASATAIQIVAVLAACVVVLPIYIGLYVFAIAGITQAAVSAQRGEKLTIRGALAMVRPRFWSYFGYLLLQGLMVMVIPGVIGAAIIGGLVFLMRQAGLAGGVFLGFLIFLVATALVVVIVYLALGYCMGMAVSVAEQKPAWEALQRAAELSKGSRGRIFVLFLLLMVLSMIVSTASYIIALIVGGVAALMGTGSTAAMIVAAVGGILYVVISMSAQVVLQPLPWIALVYFYYDQRIRKEGFDIEQMMTRAGMIPPPGGWLAATPQSVNAGVGGALSGPGGAIAPPPPPPDTVGES